MHLYNVFSSRILLFEISMQKSYAPPKYLDQLDYHVDHISLLYIDDCRLHWSKSSLKKSNCPLFQVHWNSCPTSRLPFVFADLTYLSQNRVISVFSCTYAIVNFTGEQDITTELLVKTGQTLWQVQCSSFMTYRRFVTRLTRRVSLLEQELLTLSEHLS